VAAVSLSPDDLTPFATIEATKAQAMIDDALALAARVAPCINDDTFAYDAAAKAILRGAILRWNEAGTGAMQQQTAGPYGMTVDTRQQRKGMFWPSEIEQLQDLCKGEETSGAFAIDMVGTGGTAAGHAESCALNFGALYCSCGYVLTQSLPLYGA
jgi:hypothetical protein